jgi:mRNA interferase MazF
VLCQITSNRYADSEAIEIKLADFSEGGLRLVSYARPGKLFTVSHALMKTQVGSLRNERLKVVVEGVVKLLRAGL